MDDIAELWATIDQRRRPEDVAALVGRVLAGGLNALERRTLGQVARHSERHWLYPTLMPQDWERPVGARRQLDTLGVLFDTDTSGVDDTDPAAIREGLDRLGGEIGWARGARVPARADAPANMGRRALTRAWRALEHTAAKADRLERMAARRHMAQLGRIGFANRITLEQFTEDPDAGAYVAYVAARANVRRTFTLDGRDNNIDHLAALLYARCEANPDTDWWMVAQITPTADVLAHLDEHRRGELLGAWWAEMAAAGRLLATLDAEAPVDRATMIVQRGCDSDTWNLAAGAFNRARAAWLSILTALDATTLLDDICPPKAMRVMAADLIWWHSSTGGDRVHPDVTAASLLPAAWDVTADRAACTRTDIAAACAAAGVDAERTGWLAPHTRRDVATFRPTPELVHGIAVGDPLLAQVLRRGRAFSGKPISDELHQTLDRLADDGDLDGWRG